MGFVSDITLGEATRDLATVESPHAGSVSPDRSADVSRGPYSPHRQTLLRPEEVRELSRLRVGPPMRDCAIAWMEILGAWTAVALWPQWWVVLLAVPFVGSASYALHILGHDALHRRIHPNPRRNDWFADLFLYGPVAAVTHVVARNHALHHLHLATPADPDRHKYASAEKASKKDLLLYVCGLSGLLPAIRNVFLRRASDVTTEAADAGFAASGGDAKVGYTKRDFAVIVSWQLLLLAALTGSIGWWAYPLLWLLPVYFFRFCADEIRQFLEHAHPEPDEVADGHRLITHASNRIERRFLSPLHMNLHTAHHLWPSIPYYNLPRADQLIRERNRSADLVWRGSFLRALLTYWQALPLPAAAAKQ